MIEFAGNARARADLADGLTADRLEMSVRKELVDAVVEDDHSADADDQPTDEVCRVEFHDALDEHAPIVDDDVSVERALHMQATSLLDDELPDEGPLHN